LHCQDEANKAAPELWWPPDKAVTGSISSALTSRILAAVHETSTDLGRLGFIDKRKQQQIEVLCQQPIPPCDRQRIRALRQRLQLSQTVLASVLNASPSSVRKWESGEKQPSGPSLKLLHLLECKGLEAVL
jgi:putative transcriptional regulator